MLISNIKLSDLTIGTILKVTPINKIFSEFYIILTDLLKEINADTKKFYWFTIKGQKLFRYNRDNRFDLNRIKKEEVFANEYPVDNYTFEIFSKKDLPLLINEKNKTSYFYKALNNEFEKNSNFGKNYHSLMIKILKDEHNISPI